MDYFEKKGDNVSDPEARACLGTFGLGGKISLETPLAQLSGGQKVGGMSGTDREFAHMPPGSISDCFDRLSATPSSVRTPFALLENRRALNIPFLLGYWTKSRPTSMPRLSRHSHALSGVTLAVSFSSRTTGKGVFPDLHSLSQLTSHTGGSAVSSSRAACILEWSFRQLCWLCGLRSSMCLSSSRGVSSA